MTDGLILLNKPAGITSFQAARQVGKILNEKKTGHTGTLDPQAEGLMIILLGKCTKLSGYCQADHKIYHAEFSFGKKTDTDDCWGTVLGEKTPAEHSVEELQAAAQYLVGDIEQIPPMYSAVHFNGKKLYELARKGVEVERQKRKVHVDWIRIEKGTQGHWVMDACVSSGTYIRTLIHDLGERVGEYAAMTFLQRQAIGSITLSMAQSFDEIADHPSFIDPRLVISKSWPLVSIQDDRDVKNGKAVKLDIDEKQVILVKDDKILAAYEKRTDGLYHCVRGLW